MTTDPTRARPDTGGGLQDRIERVSQSAQETRSYYNRISRFYDRLAERSEGPLRHKGLELLAARADETVVEVGCGTGHGLAELDAAVGEGGRVIGLDLAEGMLLEARRSLARAGSGDATRLICGTALALPLADACADALASSFTLELFDTPDIPRALAEWWRVLKPNGRLAVVSLSKEPDGFSVKAYEWTHRHFPHIADCRPIYVTQAIRDAGFAIERTLHETMWMPVEVVLARRRTEDD